jgi:hydrogenase nickel incorporation protein HypA/HybF
VHELPVTQGVIDLVVETAEKSGARRVLSVDLVVGDLSSIVDDSVQFYFDILSRGTLAEGAVLRFERVAATAVCLDCGFEEQVSAPLTPFCSECGSSSLRIEGGREFRVSSIEVDDEDPSSQRDP